MAVFSEMTRAPKCSLLNSYAFEVFVENFLRVFEVRSASAVDMDGDVFGQFFNVVPSAVDAAAVRSHYRD